MEIHSSFSFQAIFESITDPVSVHDMNFRVIRVNSAMCDLLGRSSQDIIGQKCYRIFHGSDAPWPSCPFVKAMQTGDAVVEEVDDPHMGIPLLVSCSPITDETGAMQGIVHIARNISRQISGINNNKHWNIRPKSALDSIKKLEGYLSICASCRKIKDEHGDWVLLEHYLADNSEVLLSHGICPECYKKFITDMNSL